MLDHNYQKTEAGRAEMKVRQLVNARAARNLLLVIDASKSARQWLGLVQGSTEADVQQLLDLGLIRAAGAAAPAPATEAAPAPGPAA
ncbi:MAG TPA: hypothetical protein VK195_10480, partial [Burkholderiaceae bacterium]|nr:hypothetical protein [Burkholderiaceae bacterium]